MNVYKFFSTLVVVLFLSSLVASVAFAADKSKESPLKTERVKTKHGSAVRNEYRTFAHTCIDSNADSRASARNGVCFIEVRTAEGWQLLDHNASRDASVWRSLSAAVLNGTGAAFVQGHFAVKAAEKLCSGNGRCGGTTINNTNMLEANQAVTGPTITVGVDTRVELPCTGICPGG